MIEEPAQGINWTAVNTAIGVISGVIVAVGAYLRMFIKGELASMESKLMTTIEAKFSTKELVTIKITDIERRLAMVESRMERIRIQKERDDER